MKKFIRLTFLICLTAAFSLNLAAQGNNAKITGTIIDALSGEALIGTNIAIKGTSMGASSDLNGEYTITNVPPGTHTIIFKYIGYKMIEEANVQLGPGEALKLDKELSPEAIMGEEVVVTVQARGQMAAINQQRASNSITNIVAADRIREMPDVNAAESIGRLPGVSLLREGGEGDKVVIRGLSPQFSVISVDGVRMPGASEDRSVGLSTVSSEMLDGIELSKSLTADQDADAIGGIVNLRTRVAAEGFHFNVYGTGGYNNIHNSFNNYKFSGSVGNRFFDNKLGVLASGGIERVDRSADEFFANYSKHITETEDLIQTDNAEVRETKRSRERVNGSLVLDYKTDFMSLKLNNIYSKRTDNVEGRTGQYIFTSNQYHHDVRTEVPEESFQMHALATEFKLGNTVLEVDYSYSRSLYERNRDLYHFEDEESLTPNPIDPNKLIGAQPDNLIRDYYDEVVDINKSVVRWNEKENEIRDDNTHTANVNWKVPYRMRDISGFLKAGFRYKKKIRSANQTTSWTYFHGGIGDGRMDIFYNNVYPDFVRAIDVGSTNGQGLAAVNFLDSDYDYGNFLDGRYNFPWAINLPYIKEVFDNVYQYVIDDPNQNYDRFHQLRGPDSYRDDYETSEQLIAGFVMAEINIGKRIMLLPGIRYESIQTVYTSNSVYEDYFDDEGLATGYPDTVTAERENAHWFPSVNLKIDVTDWMDIRGAYYRSASRPDFRFLSPSLTLDYNKVDIRSYNPYLYPALADNYDLGVSFFTNKVGLFTINGFYKDIDNLVYEITDYKPNYLQYLKESGAPPSFIESLEAPESLYDPELYTEYANNDDKPINNPNKSSYYGFELSWQSNFWYLPGILSGLVLDLNYTMLWSSTELPYMGFEEGIDSSGPFPITVWKAVYETRESRMLDQPARIFNARIGWDYKGFSSRVSFRYQGSTITEVDPLHSLLDEENLSMFRVDLMLQQEITKRMSVSLNIANLNNYIDDRVVDALGVIYPKQSEYYGMNIVLGVRYDF